MGKRKQYSANKDCNKLIREMVKQGWRYQVKGKHAQLCSPNGEQKIMTSLSPSDTRAYHNFKQNIAKCGYKKIYPNSDEKIENQTKSKKANKPKIQPEK